MNVYGKIKEVRAAQEQVAMLGDQAFILEKKQSVNIAVKEYYMDSEHFYLDKYLEKLKFLEPEIESLHKLESNKNFAGDENVKQRIEFLSGDGNSMLFSEGNMQSYQYLQETIATLVHPVEVNLSDLKKVLTMIEGIDIPPNVSPSERPQLIILDLRLDRKDITFNNQVFVLNLKLLVREYTP